MLPASELKQILAIASTVLEALWEVIDPMDVSMGPHNALPLDFKNFRAKLIPSNIRQTHVKI